MACWLARLLPRRPPVRLFTIRLSARPRTAADARRISTWLDSPIVPYSSITSLQNAARPPHRYPIGSGKSQAAHVLGPRLCPNSVGALYMIIADSQDFAGCAADDRNRPAR